MANNAKPKGLPVSQVFLDGILINNPILVQVVGICPVAAAAFSVKAGALLAVVFSLVLIVTQFIACVFLKKIPRWIRVAVYLVTGLAVVCPIMYLLDKNNFGIRLTVGIYLPLMAASSLAALFCEKTAVRSSLKNSFIGAVAVCAGYSAVLIPVGFVRELLGNGSIAGIPVHFVRPASGMLMPFGGFLVLGFAAALLRRFLLNHYPKQAEDNAFTIVTTAVNIRQKRALPVIPAVIELPPAGPPKTEIPPEEPAAEVPPDESGLEVPPLQSIPEDSAALDATAAIQSETAGDDSQPVSDSQELDIAEIPETPASDTSENSGKDPK